MRKIALIICAEMMIASTTLRAQEVKPIEPSIEEVGLSVSLAFIILMSSYVVRNISYSKYC